MIADGFKIDDFGPDAAFVDFKEMLDARDRHKEMFALMRSLRTHDEIPSTFEGEIPELVFGDDKHPRLQIGHWYLVPDENGIEVPGKLTSAVMLEGEKRIMGAYELSDGRNILASCSATDDEVAGYKKYSDTFFGARHQGKREVKNVVDLFDFFFETYQHSSKEKLLSFIAGASDFEELKKLSQRDLAITYCERCALSQAESRKDSTKRPEPYRTTLVHSCVPTLLKRSPELLRHARTYVVRTRGQVLRRHMFQRSAVTVLRTGATLGRSNGADTATQDLTPPPRPDPTSATSDKPDNVGRCCPGPARKARDSAAYVVIRRDGSTLRNYRRSGHWRAGSRSDGIFGNDNPYRTGAKWRAHSVKR